MKSLTILYELRYWVYYVPLGYSLLYIYLQFLQDRYHRNQDQKVYKNLKYFLLWISMCFIPIINIVVMYVGIKVVIKSIYLDIKQILKNK